MKLIDLVQGADEWRQARLGVPTASRFSELVTSTGELSKSLKAYAADLAAERYAGAPMESWEGNQWTERGHELEDAARATYEFTRGVQVVQVGFITDDDGRWGCSPDSLVSDDGMVEFKCLKTSRHIGMILDYKKRKSLHPDYIQQAVGQLVIAEREWNDVVFYHPALPMLVVRTNPITEVVAGLRAALPIIEAERDSILTTLKEFANA